MNIFLRVFDYWVSGGLLLIPIGIVSFLIWMYFLSVHHYLKTALKSPADLGDRIKSYLETGGFQSFSPTTTVSMEGKRKELSIREGGKVKGYSNLNELNRWLSKLDGIVPEWASKALVRNAKGVKISDTMDECRLVELPRIEHEMTILSALVIAAPMLGLLGTVLGMTTTFCAVSQQSADTTNMVSGGISQALITTQLGLVSAIPGVFGLAYLRHMYGQLKIKIDILERHLSLAIRKVVPDKL